MNLRLLLNNLLDTATLSVSPALAASLPADNLKIARRDAVARTTGLNTQHVYGNLAAPNWIDTVALWGHNLTSGGSWRIRLYDAADRTGTLVYDSGAQAAVALKTLGELTWGISPLNEYWSATGVTPHTVLALTTAVYAASFDLEWSDAANPAGYTQVGRVYLGKSFVPTVNFDWGQSLRQQDDSSYLRSAAGSLFVDRSNRYRVLTLTLSWLTDEEVTRLFDELGARGKETDVLVSAYPDAGPGRRLQHTLAARLSELPEVTRRFLNTSATALTFVEI